MFAIFFCLLVFLFFPFPSPKCLTLYAREVLSKPEMLSLVRDLLQDATEKAFDHGRGGGSREANDLIERFKDILTQRGVLPNPLERAWFTPKVTMEELLQASQCTPSFRMLPEERDVAPCSGRSQKDQSVLNDMWVSIPTGSEDSTFARQMRKNVHEEALWKVEDERFECDMVRLSLSAHTLSFLSSLSLSFLSTDSRLSLPPLPTKVIDANDATIAVLEPLVEEAQRLRRSKESIAWQFRLDRRSLSTTHLKAIARIYGGQGNEVLELLRRSPAAALPVILKRLKQKQSEWRRAQKESARKWRATVGANYPKSLDHRAFYFKQLDKKRLTAKSLVKEARAATSGPAHPRKDGVMKLDYSSSSLDASEPAVAAPKVAHLHSCVFNVLSAYAATLDASLDAELVALRTKVRSSFLLFAIFFCLLIHSFVCSSILSFKARDDRIERAGEQAPPREQRRRRDGGGARGGGGADARRRGEQRGEG